MPPRLDAPRPERRPIARELPAPLPKKAFRGETVLACAACRQWITDPSLRIEIAGAHEHERTNPAGITYRFGCYVAARGLVLSEPFTEVTWFPGYAWEVAGCSLCAEHLGWRFSSADRAFFALIRDRLVELDVNRA